MPELTEGKLKDIREEIAEKSPTAGVEGGVVAIFAFIVGISLLESKSVAKRTVFRERAGAEAPLVALLLFFFSRLSRSSQPFAMR